MATMALGRAIARCANRLGRHLSSLRSGTVQCRGSTASKSEIGINAMMDYFTGIEKVFVAVRDRILALKTPEREDE
jgi:hypothetical protein